MVKHVDIKQQRKLLSSEQLRGVVSEHLVLRYSFCIREEVACGYKSNYRVQSKWDAHINQERTGCFDFVKLYQKSCEELKSKKKQELGSGQYKTQTQMKRIDCQKKKIINTWKHIASVNWRALNWKYSRKLSTGGLGRYCEEKTMTKIHGNAKITRGSKPSLRKVSNDKYNATKKW